MHNPTVPYTSIFKCNGEVTITHYTHVAIIISYQKNFMIIVSFEFQVSYDITEVTTHNGQNNYLCCSDIMCMDIYTRPASVVGSATNLDGNS